MDLHYYIYMYVYVCIICFMLFYVILWWSLVSFLCSALLLLLHLYNIPQSWSSITLWIFVFIRVDGEYMEMRRKKKENRKIEIQDFSFYALLTYLKGFTIWFWIFLYLFFRIFHSRLVFSLCIRCYFFYSCE